MDIQKVPSPLICQDARKSLGPMDCRGLWKYLGPSRQVRVLQVDGVLAPEAVPVQLGDIPGVHGGVVKAEPPASVGGLLPCLSPHLRQVPSWSEKMAPREQQTFPCQG